MRRYTKCVDNCISHTGGVECQGGVAVRALHLFTTAVTHCGWGLLAVAVDIKRFYIFCVLLVYHSPLFTKMIYDETVS